MTYLTQYQQQRLEQLRNMTSAQRDAICKRCGVCCLYKWNGPFGKTLFMDLHCEHLNPRTRMCNVYNKRTRVCDECRLITPDIIIEGRLLPASCGYMEYVFGPAQLPARIDNLHTQPITDKGFDFLTPAQLAQHIIQESVFWNIH